jgi:hypothetical protein
VTRRCSATTEEAHVMPEANSSQSFPQSQRELVGLALRRGACRPGSAPAAPGSQRDRVALALALGLGGSRKGPAAGVARRGIYR